jgi:hypothetical protein
MPETPRPTFQYGIWIFDVTAAEQLVTATGQLPIVPLDVPMWAHAYGQDRDDPSAVPLLGPGDNFDRAYTMTTDLSRPLLLATVPTGDGASGHLLIDGCHRLFHAWSTGRVTLTAHELGRVEADSILLHRPMSGADHSTRFARQPRIPRPRSGGRA